MSNTNNHLVSHFLPIWDESTFCSSAQNLHLTGEGDIAGLENKLKSYYDKSYAVAFCNATTALHVVALALNLRDAEIITSPITWGGSISPFLFMGNKIRFSSVEPDSLLLAANNLGAAMTVKTKAVLSVDINGIPADSYTIKKFCAKSDLFYISDSAQSFGAFRDGKPAGYYADAIILSFGPGKSLFAGEGGAVLTDDESLFEKMLWFSQHASRQKVALGISQFNEYAPINGRMNPLGAALLNSSFEFQLIRLRTHQENCFKVLQILQQKKHIKSVAYIPSAQSSSFFNFSLEIMRGKNLDDINKFLKNNNCLLTAVAGNYTLIPYDPSFAEQFKGRFTCSRQLSAKKNKVRMRINLLLNSK